MELVEIEQYARRNCFKISGIPEEKDENTDTRIKRPEGLSCTEKLTNL